VRLGIVITRAALMDATWTTLALARAALDRGHEVRLIERTDIEVDPKGRVIARAFSFDPPGPAVESMADDLRMRLADRRFVDLERLDLLLLRSAPLSAELLGFAQLLRDRGVAVVNDPDGLSRLSSKAWLASLPGVPTPPTLITRSPGSASVFYRQQRTGAVVKPARGSGGRAVSFVPPGQLSRFDAAFEECRAGEGHVVVQAYLPAAERGEKRLLWLDGEILGGYLRTRAPGEFRHNLKQGGQASAAEVTPAERELLAPLTPHLVAAGIRFAGIDLIGRHVVEVNAVNPGGTFHTDRLTGSSHATTVVARLERPAPRSSIPEVIPWVSPEH
jgi:glutathione synthase